MIPNTVPASAFCSRTLRALVVGASAGGIEAVGTLLSALPRPLSVPVLVVLHVAKGSKTAWPLLFPRSTAPIFEAEDKEVAEPGSVHIAPPDYHLLVDTAGQLSLSVDERVNFARPSIDVLFESAALAYGTGLLGIVLTGANSDGAQGLLAIHERGGLCWVQAPDTAAAKAMPRAAALAVPEARVLPLLEMAEALRAVLR